MSPVSLLFCSDEETSRPLVQALRELELEVESCLDVFTVVEWLTSRSFDVIVADCDAGPEAEFLLKNARELKLNQAAFTLGLTSGTAKGAGGEDSPDLVLTKPFTPDQIKYALLTNDRFLACMKAWIARGDFVHAEGASHAVPANQGQKVNLERPSPAPPPSRPNQTSAAKGYAQGISAPLNLTFATLDRRFFRSKKRSIHSQHISRHLRRSGLSRVLWGSALSMALVSAAYLFGQPLHVQSVFASVAIAYKQVETKFSGSQESEDAVPDPATVAQAASQAGSRRYSPSRPHQITVRPVPLPDDTPMSPTQEVEVDAHLDQGHIPLAPRIQIPDSLKSSPADSGTVRSVSLRRSPSLLGLVEPVPLPEDLSQQLLVDKVQPSYPEQALRAGLQGAVVLQAWIGRDGSIRDLKLVEGPFLLGQAAVNAVRQWRYKPYLRNGVAVEAETYVTVNFRLP